MVKGKSNPVAKFSKKFNKGGPMRDRKKALKRGEVKHKGKQLNSDAQQTDTSNRTNASAKKPQNYVDPVTGKTKTRMVPVHKDIQNEKLDPSMGIKKYIDDFQKSDAPQFQGKSKEKRKEMAIAAYLDAKRGEKKEGCWDGYKQVGMKKKNDKMVPNCVPESTAAYGQSQAAIRAKKQRAGMSTSDQHKMGKVADMMRREREKRAAQQRNETKEEAYNPRAARAQSHAANKMYGRTSDPIDKKPASAAKKPISKADLFRAIDKKYGSAKKKTGIFATRKEDAEARARLKLKHAKEKENLKNRHSKEREAMKESMDPRDFTDKPGHVVVVKKKDGTRSIKHYHPTSAGAKKYADRVNKVNKVGDKATVHKTDGRKIHEASQKLTNKKAELRKKMFGNANYLSPAQRKELDKAAKAALKKDSASKKAAPPKPVSKTSKGKVRTGSADPADRNIFMQLRKAQDRGGNQAITVSPTGKKVTLNPKQIDMLLKRHDSLQKPVDKRKFKIMLIKSLRAKAK